MYWRGCIATTIKVNIMGGIHDRITPFNPDDYFQKPKPAPSPEPALPPGAFYNPPSPSIPMAEDDKENKA